jgi:glycosyltransferase involved in cell wall biosynthesis
LHSAVQDTLPLTLLEALACGRPVISTNEGGTAESVDEGKTGLLVAPGRPDAMARALRELIANPTRRAAMGEAGRAVACARFDAGTQIAKLHAWCADYAQRRAAVIARQAGRAALPAVVSSRETAGTA